MKKFVEYIKKKRIVAGFCVVIFAFCGILSAYGQDDARAQRIIDDMTAKLKAYPSVGLEFSAVVTQMQDKSEVKEEGKLWLKGNKYKLELSEYVIYYDGAKIYQYLPEVNEVNVTKPEPETDDEDFQMLNPQSYLNLSSKNFKSKLVKESILSNRKVYEIDLYPIQIKTARYSRIRVMVERNSMQLAHLKAFLNDGTDYTLTFNPYEIFQTAKNDDFFTFNKAEHPHTEVIDLTF